MGLFMSAKREPRGERLRARMGFDLPDTVPPITAAATGIPNLDMHHAHWILTNSCITQQARVLQSAGLAVLFRHNLWQEVPQLQQRFCASQLGLT